MATISNKMINISVVIPVYNVAPYIKECLESVLNQTFTDGVECILVDDCGTDNSLEIIDSVVSNYQGDVKVKILHHPHNKGLGAARNTGLREVSGKYVFFIDSDDYITNTCLESLWKLGQKYPKAEVIHGIEFAKGEQQNEDFHLCVNKFKLPEYSEDRTFVRRESILNHYTIHVFNSLYRTDFLKSNQLEFIEGVIFEDFPWMMDLSRKVNAVAFCVEDTYFYRQHEKSIMGSLNSKCIESVAKDSDHMLSNIGLDETYKFELFRIIEFMHIYDEKYGKCPLELMKYGDNFIFSKLYKIMYKQCGVLGKIEKEILINLFKIQQKISR